MDVKTSTLDLADFAITRIPIRLFFLAYSGTSIELQMFLDLFLRVLPQLYNITFLGTHCCANLADCRKLCTNSHNGKQSSIFTVVFWQKYLYDGPKYMFGIWIPVKLNPDFLKQIRILERSMAVRALNFQSHSLSCGKICQI
jgi:hypothetical protein